MLPAGLLLVLEGFLGVIGGASRVFYRTLNMGINPGQNQLKTLKVSDDHVNALGAQMIWMILVLLGLSRCHWDAD